ncbi:MAG: exonuclease SbcCD subunit D C-terminal domain-containing protein [Fibromonadaceae bacterium]|jgi:exonuclease SbcD|nr:exonuclease SbcCD subunit D C-terminal domain-containing protein [Fibromonadaceae bacterium]
MKLLHTSDWHLGRMLYSKKERSEEHERFLEWLLSTIKENGIDALLIAGDIFDSASPSNLSLKMYYDFLLKVRSCGCGNVVVVGGNHDSPSLLDAPKEILSALNVKVVGKACENLEDEVIVLENEDKKPIAVICAVPFLRERDISRFAEGETYSDRSKRIRDGLSRHYAEIAEIAKNKFKKLNKKVPIVATGHLSVKGGKANAGDGVRETYIGTIECIESGIFSAVFDYIALGHFHVASAISERIRYCGSPIPMGFSEAGQQKSVVIADFEKNIISEIKIPEFQKLQSIKGDKNFISKKLSELKSSAESVWVEIIYEGNELFADFQAWIDAQITGTKIEPLKIQDKRFLDNVLAGEYSEKNLEELNEFDVFDKLLESKDFPYEQKDELRELYREIAMPREFV